MKSIIILLYKIRLKWNHRARISLNEKQWFLCNERRKYPARKYENKGKLNVFVLFAVYKLSLLHEEVGTSFTNLMCKAHYELTDWLKHLSYFLDKSSKTEFSAIATQVLQLCVNIRWQKNDSITTHGKYL